MKKDAAKSDSWQAEKSEQMRKRIMEATIQCYLKLGYTNTTVTKIAEEADVSRGAMMHHFDSRFDIIKASLTYITEKRSNEFKALVSAARTEGGTVVNEENLRITVNALWKFFHNNSYIALQELLIAARTDAELAAIMRPAQRELDQDITNSIRTLFPAWSDITETQEVLTDLYFYTLQGMAISKITNKETRVKNLLELLVKEGLYEFNKSKKQ